MGSSTPRALPTFKRIGRVRKHAIHEGLPGLEVIGVRSYRRGPGGR
jgi:hypothetical protein